MSLHQSSSLSELIEPIATLFGSIHGLREEELDFEELRVLWDRLALLHEYCDAARLACLREGLPAAENRLFHFQKRIYEPLEHGKAYDLLEEIRSLSMDTIG